MTGGRTLGLAREFTSDRRRWLSLCVSVLEGERRTG